MRCISKSWLALIFAFTACTLCASSKSSNANELQGRQRVLHALNRLTFGARWPGLSESQLYEGAIWQ